MKLLVALVLAAVAATPAQKPAPFIESMDVVVHNVDAIVTDRAGNRVHGLQKSDFELLENNAPQAITNFYEVRGPASAPVADEAAPAAEPRRFVILFDELSLHPTTAGDMQHRADQLIDEAMRPGDELMVLTPMAKTKIALPFTSDKHAIHKAIAAVMRDSAFHASTAVTRERMLFERDVVNAGDTTIRPALAQYELLVTRRVRQTLGYLQATVTALAEVQGKKSVIFVTQSAPMRPGGDVYDLAGGNATMARTLQPYIDDIARTASTNGVTIYCLMPDIALGSRIPDIMGGGRVVRSTARTLPIGGPAGAAFAGATWETEQTFRTLTETTGGKWWLGGGGVKPMFRQVADDTTDYYALGYRASEERDRPRTVVVRVRNHPEYSVRSRHAVVRKSAPNEMRDLVIAGLLDNHGVDELNVRVSAGKATREVTGNLLVPVDIKIPLSKLTFLRDGDVYRASFRVHYAAETPGFDFAPGEGREQVVEVPSAEMPNIGGKYYTYTSSLRVRPGELKVSVGVLDSLSHLATIKTMTVEARAD